MEVIFDKELNDYVCCAEPILWSVVSVEPREDFTLLLSFADGSRRVFDFASLLAVPCYEKLGSVTEFMRARVRHGTVDWGGDIDIAPERLYCDSRILD